MMRDKIPRTGTDLALSISVAPENASDVTAAGRETAAQQHLLHRQDLGAIDWQGEIRGR
jgi:hypothetical protein